jgi:hypothetical protein
MLAPFSPLRDPPPESRHAAVVDPAPADHLVETDQLHVPVHEAPASIRAGGVSLLPPTRRGAASPHDAERNRGYAPLSPPVLLLCTSSSSRDTARPSSPPWARDQGASGIENLLRVLPRLGSDRGWCLGAPGSNGSTGSQHQSTPTWILPPPSRRFAAGAPFSSGVVPRRGMNNWSANSTSRLLLRDGRHRAVDVGPVHHGTLLVSHVAHPLAPRFGEHGARRLRPLATRTGAG